jgi:hypothetical protein
LECRLTPDDWRDAVEQAREQGQRDERQRIKDGVKEASRATNTETHNAYDTLRASDNGEWVKYADTLPRTLTADDPEPAVGSVVLDGSGLPWLRIASGWCVVFDFAGPHRWGHVTSEGPVRLIWDGSSE